MLARGQGFMRASIYAGPRALPQCLRQLCIIKNLWQPGEPCKLFKILNIYGLKRALLQTVFKMSGTVAGKASALLWSSGDAPLGSGMVAKMWVPELSDSIFMVPSN